MSETQDGSLFKVPLTKILKIENHPGADRLDLATVYGFQVVVGKGQYKVDDEVIYIPIDSILPFELEQKLFPEGSKIKLHHNRVRQIKIRGLVSQGMLVDIDSVAQFLGMDKVRRLGTYETDEDLSDSLGITKYEPPVTGPSHTIGKDKNRNKTYENKLFHKYNGLTALKWVPSIFDGEEVVIQEKLHGTNARAGILPYEANNLWKKFKKLVGLAPAFEKCYGSNNVEVSAKFSRKTGFYEGDIYGDAFKNIDVYSKLKPGEIVFGEIIGPNIQANYSYGLTSNRFVLFDVKVLGSDGKFKWLNPEDVQLFAKERDFEFVPVLYTGIWDKELAYSLTFGPSVYAPVQKVREGIVVKSRFNYDIDGNKKAYKWVSEIYLEDKTNSDDH